MLNSSSRIALAVFAAALMGAAQAGPNIVPITAPAENSLRGVSLFLGETVAGHYRMFDGRIMVLKQRGSTIVANLDGVPLTPLMATSNGGLRAANDSMRISFAPANAKDDTTLVTVSLRVDGSAPFTLAAVSQPMR